MSSPIGVWRHEMPCGGMTIVTTQTIRDDGTYETHMIYPSPGGGRQHIHHHGRIEFDESTLRLHFESGKTRMEACADPAQNFDLRDFTAAEHEEATGLLAQEVPYVVEGDTLTTTVLAPGVGEVKIAYTRVT